MLLFIVSFVSSTMVAAFVNKYVLSVLKFTYPTVYQSWQMLMISTTLCLLFCLGLINFSNIERNTIQQWCPAMCFFSITIYSGSVALSRLPIPVFFASLHFVFVVCTIADTFMFKKEPAMLSLLGLALGLVGLFFSISIYPVDFLGHRWMFVHCLSSASYMIFARGIFKGKLSEFEKAMLNSSFSIMALLLIGIFSGEVSRAFSFPYLFNINFHRGCITSGITGALLSLSYGKLATSLSISKLRWIGSTSMVITSVISLFIFPLEKPFLMELSTLITLSGSAIYTYSESIEEFQNDIQLEKEQIA